MAAYVKPQKQERSEADKRKSALDLGHRKSSATHCSKGPLQKPAVDERSGVRALTWFVSDRDDQGIASILAHQLDKRGQKLGYADDRQDICAWVTDGAGTLVGGIAGYTLWGWLKINYLWVSDNHQRRGFGSGLLSRAETKAKTRGCRGVFLDTFDFQAPDFYAKLGYQRFGSFQFDIRHKRNFFFKVLD